MKLFKTYADQKENLNNFHSKYGSYLLYRAPQKRPSNRKSQKERFCWFCQKKYPDVTFKNDPHIIPELLGRNFGVSDIECDNCNQLFSRYETDLSYFLGFIRTFYFVKGKKGIPTHNHPKDSLVARYGKLSSKVDGLTISDPSRKGIEINTYTGETRLSYTKHSYIPINVYKSLLKIALTILSWEEFKFYGEIVHFISNNENHEYYTQFANVFAYTTTIRVNKPYCYIFKRKDRAKDVPSHLFALYFENMVYELFIPRYALDKELYENNKLNILFCPPMYCEVNLEGSCSGELIDLAQTSKLEDEKDSITYKLDPDWFSNAEMINPITKERTPFDPTSISKITIFKIDENSEAEDFSNNIL